MKTSIDFQSYGNCDQLCQLVEYQPVWDGNVICKTARNRCVQKGYAWHNEGWAGATLKGVIAYLFHPRIIWFRLKLKWRKWTR